MNEELKIIIRAELDKLNKELKKGNDEVKKFAKNGKESFSKFNDDMQKVGNGAKVVMKTFAGALAGVAAALLATASQTKEYRTNQAKLVTAFETAGAAADTAKGVYKDLYRVLGDDGKAVEAAQHLAKLTTNQVELEHWTKITQGVYATFGDSLPIEGLTEAINHTVNLGEVQGNLADALEWAGITVEDFNAELLACNTEAEREALIRETLSGLYGEAAENYEKNAAGVLAENEAQMKLDETMAKLGATMAPILAQLAEFASIVLDQISPAIEEFVAEHGEKFTKTLTDIAESIGKVLTWVMDNWDFVGSIATVIIAIAVAIGVFSTAMSIANAVMLANPVVLVVTAIIAAVAAATVLIIKYWDEIKAFFVKLANWIADNWQSLLLFIVNPFAGAFKILYENCDGFREFIDNLVKKVGGFFKNMWDGLKNGAKSAWEGVKSVFSAVTGWFTNVFTKAWQGVKNVFSAGGKIFDGIKDGIANVFKTVVNGIIGGINKVISVPFNAINSALSKLKGVSIAGLKPFSWITTFNVPQIPKLARGGIIDGATLAMVGEQGKEAVVPLENNLGWLDKLASMLGDKMGNSNKPIYLVVDKRVLGQVSAEGINAITKQTGKIPLAWA